MSEQLRPATNASHLTFPVTEVPIRYSGGGEGHFMKSEGCMLTLVPFTNLGAKWGTRLIDGWFVSLHSPKPRPLLAQGSRHVDALGKQLETDLEGAGARYTPPRATFCREDRGLFLLNSHVRVPRKPRQSHQATEASGGTHRSGGYTFG